MPKPALERVQLAAAILCRHKRLVDQQIRQEDTVLAPGLPSHQVVTEWQYDPMGRLVTLTEAVGTPEQKRTTHSYNHYGQKTCTHLPDGTQLKHQYDSLGRLKHYHASDNSFDYTYTYDKNHNLLSAVDAQNNKTERIYDHYNQIIKEQLSNGLEMNYSYDRLGRLTRIELPDHTGIAYTYDAVHLKTVKRLSDTPYEHSYTKYDLSSNLLEEQTPCGQVTYEWDPLDQAKAIRSHHFTEEIGRYDPVGNLLEKTRQRHTACKYTYDALDQLQTESVAGLTKHEYLYDSLNNRRKLDGEEHTVNHLNQLLSHGNNTYTYDAKGHLIAEQSPATNAQYTYDALGRLTSLTSNGETYTYQYDAFNRRTKKITPQGEERYLYIDQNEIGLVNSRNEIVQLRILGSGKGAEIGSAIALELEGQTYVPIHDHAGNISVLIDLISQKTAESYTYSAFGETKREGTPVPNPWFFSSKRFDPESDWIYFGRRYYDSNTGRWMTPDPLGFADGPNLYAYVHNNPLTHFDLYGLATMPGPASGSSGIASGGSRGISSGSFRSTSGYHRDSNSGSGSSKWDGGRREEDSFFPSIDKNMYQAARAHAELNAAISYQTNTMYTNAVAKWAYEKAHGRDMDLEERLEEISDYKTLEFYKNEQAIEFLFEVDTKDKTYNIIYGLLHAEKLLDYHGYMPGMMKMGGVKGSCPKPVLRPHRSRGRPHRGGACNANAYPALIKKLSQLENLPREGVRVRVLSDGRLRFYFSEKPAKTTGPTRGSNRVIEWNPETGQTRFWQECYDQTGKVNRVHPKNINGQEANFPHYPPTATEVLNEKY